MEEIDTSNKFLVGINRDLIIVMMIRQTMSKDEALNLAAWLVALADPEGNKFKALLEAVMNT